MNARAYTPPLGKGSTADYDRAIRLWTRETLWRRATLEEFPTEHSEFRAAWVSVGDKVSVDMDRARDVTRNRLRAERVPALAALDIDAIRAVEAGDQPKLNAITAEKQRLRDITALPAIDAAKTPKTLKELSLQTKVKQ